MSDKQSRFDQAVQRHPVLLHLLGVLSVPILIVFAPILLYGILLPTETSFLSVVRAIPWGPVLFIIAIAAALSLLQTPWGVQIQESDAVDGNRYRPIQIPRSTDTVLSVETVAELDDDSSDTKLIEG